jgi:hypothetical protein
MPADSILAAHLALTEEMSAHPVSESSFKKRLSYPTPIHKEASNLLRRGIMPPKAMTQCL